MGSSTSGFTHTHRLGVPPAKRYACPRMPTPRVACTYTIWSGLSTLRQKSSTIARSSSKGIGTSISILLAER